MATAYRDVIVTPNRASGSANATISFRGGNTTVNTAMTTEMRHYGRIEGGTSINSTSTTTSKNQIVVSPGHNTISAAVAAMANGDTILLQSGTYIQSETIQIPVGVTHLAIKGQGSATTKIQYTVDVHGIASQGLNSYSMIETTRSGPSTQLGSYSYTTYGTSNNWITTTNTGDLALGKVIAISNSTATYTGQILSITNTTHAILRTNASMSVTNTVYHWDHLRIEKIELSGFEMMYNVSTISTKTGIFLLGGSYNYIIDPSIIFTDISLIYGNSGLCWQTAIKIIGARKIYKDKVTIRATPATPGTRNVAPYTDTSPTGTVTVYRNSTTVAGTGSNFNTTGKVGDFIVVYKGSPNFVVCARQITQVVSDTDIRVRAPFDFDLGGCSYVFKTGMGIQLESCLNVRMNQVWAMGVGAGVVCEQANELYVNDGVHAGCEDVGMSASTIFYCGFGVYLGNKVGWFRLTQCELENADINLLYDQYNWDGAAFRTWDTPSGGYHLLTNVYGSLSSPYAGSAFIKLSRPSTIMYGCTLQPGSGMTSPQNFIYLDNNPASPWDTNGLYTGATNCSITNNMIRYNTDGTGILVLGDKNVIMGNIFNNTGGGGVDINIISGATNNIVVGNQLDVALVDSGTGTQNAYNVVS